MVTTLVEMIYLVLVVMKICILSVAVCCTVRLGETRALEPYDSLITMPLSVPTESGQRTIQLDESGLVRGLRVRYRTGGRLGGALSTITTDAG